MPKTNLNNVTGAGSTTINANNGKIEAALENTLSRDGTAPNYMTADLDMNGHRLLNCGNAGDDADIATLADIKSHVASLKADWGAHGPGYIPPGGDKDEVLVKSSDGDYDYVWSEPSGLQGPAGPQGEKGDKGDTGDTGPQGAQGPQGDPGLDGNDGADGAQGPQGDQGPQGIQGIQGIQGDPGADGSDGQDGSQGPQGDQGIQGIQGIQGNPGADGADGQGVPVGGTAGQVLEKVDGTDYNTQWATFSGGSGATPVHTLYFEGTLSSATLNTNATSTDYTWNDAEEHANVTHTDGDSVISMNEAGEYDLYFNVQVTNGAANNRQTWALYIDHLNSSSVSLFEYSAASAQYIRDDASAYDSAAASGHFNLVVTANEKFVIRSKRLDAQTAGGNNYASDSVSYLRIFRKTYV